LRATSFGLACVRDGMTIRLGAATHDTQPFGYTQRPFDRKLLQPPDRVRLSAGLVTLSDHGG
jgi:hypothetical protein